MANDPAAQAIIETTEMPAKAVGKIAGTVASVQVSVVKPK
jgi:hypothetical protein